METHKKILSAIWSLADFQPLEVNISFRGYDAIRMDAYGIEAYKVGSFDPLVVKWEDITPVEALRLKRACRYTLARMQEEAEISLTQIIRLKETFEKSPFGC